ncbi:hypothetical protein CW712_01305 [Candidatus Bathyarchaeota archaeon]|nr:MAG: hypothetical protein CW712_01305 [Candidatus Bathyarchaeota archaeon]
MTETVKAKEAFAMFVGIFQSLTGILSITVAYLIYYNPDFFPVRTMFNLLPEHVAFYMMLLIVVGSFAIISGLLIIHEWSIRT